jgi:hypothetical protein
MTTEFLADRTALGNSESLPVNAIHRLPAALDRLADHTPFVGRIAEATAVELDRLADQAGRMGRQHLADFLAARAAELRADAVR